MSQFFAQYPAVNAGSTDPSVGTNGSAIPTSSTLVGAKNGSNNLTPLLVDGSGNLQVTASALPLPSGAATAANQTAVMSTSGTTAPASVLQVGGVDISDGKLYPLKVDKNNNNVLWTTMFSEGDDGFSAPGTGLQIGGTNPSGNFWVVNATQAADTKRGIVVDASHYTSPISAASLPLPAGAATAAKQPALGTAGSASADVITIQGIASMTAVKVDGSAVTQPVSGTVTANQGGAPWSVSQSGTWTDTSMAPLTANATVSSATTVISAQDVSKYQTISCHVQISATATVTFEASNDNSTWVACAMANIGGSGANTTVLSSSNIMFCPVEFNYFRVRCSSYTNGNVTVYFMASQHGMASDVGLRTIAVSNTVAVSQSGTWTVQPGNTANTTAWLVDQATSGTATTSSVASSASSVQLLASNSSRKQATFFNDSTQVAYLKLGTTASTTDYTVQLQPNAYYELPNPKIYSGRIDCIWAAANGNMRITELT